MYLLVDLEIEYLRKRKFPSDDGMIKINVSQTWIFLFNYSSNEYQSHCIIGFRWNINITLIALVKTHQH